MLMNKRLRTIVQYLFFFGLGILFVWLSIYGLSAKDKLEIKQALGNARYWLFIPVFIILILSHYIRSLRWRLLMEPLGFKPRIINTFFAVLIGYFTNMAVPRLGEVLKCTVLARYEKIPADKLIGTIIVERIIDAITLLIVFGITLAVQPDLYSQLIETVFHSPKEIQEKETTNRTIIFLIILSLFIIILIVWMIRSKKRITDLFILFKKIAARIWQGITAIQHLKKRGLFLLYTLLIWSLYLAGGYVGFFALQDTEIYGIREAFTVLSAGSIGMIVTPGGIGAYAFLLEKTMQLYGLPQGIALAFGWLLWLAQTAVILIGGLFSFFALPFYNKKALASQDNGII
jgi:uncharacterized protein (TIRG00374 family)